MMHCTRCKVSQRVWRGTTEVAVLDENGESTGETRREDVFINVVHRSRMFVDRVFSDNKNYEVVCLACGVRRFISKGTVFGRWLARREEIFANAAATGRDSTTST